MASFFVDSAGSNTAPYDTWAKAATSLSTAVSATTAAGDVIYVANTHAQTAPAAAITYTPPAGVTNLAIICVTPSGAASHSGWVSTPSGLENVGGAAAALTFAAIAAGNVFIHGMQFVAGTSSSANSDMNFNVSNTINNSRLECQKCKFTLNNSNTGSQFVMGAAAGNPQRFNAQRYIDCEFETLTARAGTLFLLQAADIEMVNPTFTIAGGTQPALIFGGTNAFPGSLTIRDGDISGLNPSTAIIDRATLQSYRVLFKGLKLNASPAFTGGTQAVGIGSWQLRQCSSADQLYDFHYETPYGVAVESTSTYANDGVTFEGTNLSWQITTSAICGEGRPFVLPIQTVWNTVTSSQTASVEYARDNATLLTRRQAWIDLSYPNSTTVPSTDNLDSRYTEPFDGTNTATAGTSGSSTWTESLTNNGFQKFEVTFTAAEVGLVECRFFITVASDVSYIDPQVRIA